MKSVSALRRGNATPTEDEPVRIRVWKRSENEPVDETEYRAVSTDPEREGQHGGRRESRVLPEEPQRVSDILDESLHRTSPDR